MMALVGMGWRFVKSLVPMKYLSGVSFGLRCCGRLRWIARTVVLVVDFLGFFAVRLEFFFFE